jgi:metal-sulfur cluster biosynthetic enzyme
VSTEPHSVTDAHSLSASETPSAVEATASAPESGSSEVAQNQAPESTAEVQPSTESDYIEALKQVIDPELMINVVDLGLIYSVEQDAEVLEKVKVEMTLTSPACPAGPQLVQQAKMALERLHDVNEANIVLVMSPPWTPERMTDDARDQLGIF